MFLCPVCARWAFNLARRTPWRLGDRRTVAHAAIAISRAAGLAGIAIRFWQPMACGLDQKLFPHFCEARAAVFAVEQVEYGGHE
jgi:hypothetical protein